MCEHDPFVDADHPDQVEVHELYAASSDRVRDLVAAFDDVELAEMYVQAEAERDELKRRLRRRR